MSENLVVGIGSLITFGIGAQWLAWRLRIPSILLLLVSGFIAGPVTGLLDPDAFLGELLLPVVSVSVAVILFEGGLSLRVTELGGFGGVVRNLVTIGGISTWAVTAVCARFILGLDPSISILLGAVLSVTGPTVIIPLLRHVRPVGYLGSILRWEGIVIDPIGAVLAVLVFEVILSGGFKEATSLALIAVLKSLLIGGAAGVAGAAVMVMLLGRYWIPDFLQNPVTLMMVVGVFAVSDFFQEESGLLAVTLMGMILANQERVTVKHIIEFKENLRVLLIGCLFILLAARLDPGDLALLGSNSLVFLAALIVVARPVGVLLSTIGSRLRFKERFFLMCMAPRGIVAAAMASVFSLRLMEMNHPQAELVVPLTFMVIIGTVVIYGLGAAPVAGLLGVARPNPQGVLIAGAHPWARAIASALKEEGFDVLLVDNNWANISQARMSGLPAHFGSILSERLPKELDLSGLGRFMAMTQNDNVNSLAALHFSDVFERMEIYQLAPGDAKRTSDTLRGRLLFGEGINFSFLDRRFRSGMVVKTTHLTEEFDFEAFKTRYADAIPLFLINENRELSVFTADKPPQPKPGQTLISFVRPVEDTTAGKRSVPKKPE